MPINFGGRSGKAGSGTPGPGKAGSGKVGSGQAGRGAPDGLGAIAPSLGVSILPGVPLPSPMGGEPAAGGTTQPATGASAPTAAPAAGPAPAMVQSVSAFSEFADTAAAVETSTVAAAAAAAAPVLAGVGVPAQQGFQPAAPYGFQPAVPGAFQPAGFEAAPAFQPTPLAAIGAPLQSSASVATMPPPHIAPPGEAPFEEGGHHRRAARRPLWGRKRPAVPEADPAPASAVAQLAATEPAAAELTAAPASAPQLPSQPGVDLAPGERQPEARRGFTLGRRQLVALGAVVVVAAAGGGYVLTSGGSDDSLGEVAPPVVHAVTMPQVVNGWHRVAAPGAAVAGARRLAVQAAHGGGLTGVYTANGAPVAAGHAPALVAYAVALNPNVRPLTLTAATTALLGAKHPGVTVAKAPTRVPSATFGGPALCATVVSHAGHGAVCVWRDTRSEGAFYVATTGTKPLAAVVSAVRGSLEHR